MNDDEVVFDDDELLDQPSEPQTDQEPEESDLTTEVLKNIGITNPNEIMFEDEKGNTVTRAWNDLTFQEQVNILSNRDEEETALDDDEINLINNIRQNNMTVQQYLNSLTPTIQAVQPQTDLDKLSDDEIFALDVINKLGDDVSDEDIDKAIANAKTNETLFKKTVEGIRESYKQLQEQEQQEIQLQQANLQREQYNNFSNNILNVIGNFNSIGGQEIDLTNDDKDELANFILALDENGQSNFGKALNDPTLFTKAAFWLLNGDKIVEELSKMIGKPQPKPTSTLKITEPKPNPTTSTQDFIEDDDW